MTSHVGVPGRTRALRHGVAAVAVTMAFAIGQPVAADQLVVNGGFETGDFSDWVTLNNFEFSDVLCPGPPEAFEGDCYARFGPTGSVGTLAQGLNTLAGHSYDISFAFASDGSTPNEFAASFGGVPLTSGIDIPDTGGFIVRHFTAMTPDTMTTLSFDFRNDAGYLFLDAVTVSSVPEPATLGLVGIALAGLILRRRRG